MTNCWNTVVCRVCVESSLGETQERIAVLRSEEEHEKHGFRWECLESSIVCLMSLTIEQVVTQLQQRGHHTES